MHACLLGKLAAEGEDGKQLPVEVMESENGFYLGTLDEDRLPNTRESLEYFKSRSAAEEALISGNWTQRDWN